MKLVIMQKWVSKFWMVVYIHSTHSLELLTSLARVSLDCGRTLHHCSTLRKISKTLENTPEISQLGVKKMSFPADLCSLEQKKATVVIVLLAWLTFGRKCPGRGSHAAWRRRSRGLVRCCSRCRRSSPHRCWRCTPARLRPTQNRNGRTSPGGRQGKIWDK